MKGYLGTSDSADGSDIDWFKFTTGGNGSDINIRISSTASDATYYEARIEDSNGTTLDSNGELEDKDYLYNIYTDERLLCKHYLYEVNSKNDNNIFETMKSIYGMPAKEVYIHLKNCL